MARSNTIDELQKRIEQLEHKWKILLRVVKYVGIPFGVILTAINSLIFKLIYDWLRLTIFS